MSTHLELRAELESPTYRYNCIGFTLRSGRLRALPPGGSDFPAVVCLHVSSVSPISEKHPPRTHRSAAERVSIAAGARHRRLLRRHTHLAEHQVAGLSLQVEDGVVPEVDAGQQRVRLQEVGVVPRPVRQQDGLVVRRLPETRLLY